MNKLINFSLIILVVAVIVSCGKEKKEDKKIQQSDIFTVDVERSSVQWTAYKTTDKLPVKGTFKEIKVLNMSEGKSAQASLDGLEFEIPVASIYSKDTIRDSKLNTFFFAIMENTLSLKGNFSVEDDKTGNLAISMNGLTKNLPFTYQMSKDTIMIDAKMDLNIWQAQNALESLHQACLQLHTGPDGVSKTWDEVGISAKILTQIK